MRRRNACIVIRDGVPQRRVGRKRVALMSGIPVAVFLSKGSARWAIRRTERAERNERFEFAPPPESQWNIISVELVK